MSKAQKRRRGYSMAECVVALAIIVVVSVAALSIVASSESARRKSIFHSDAQDFASNMLECFKAADNDAEFRENVIFATSLQGHGEFPLTPTDEEGVYTYEVENQYKATLKVDFTSGEFEITVNENRVSEADENKIMTNEIISFTYKKGAR